MTAILVTYVMPSSLFSAGGWARGWMTGVVLLDQINRITGFNLFNTFSLEATNFTMEPTEIAIRFLDWDKQIVAEPVTIGFGRIIYQNRDGETRVQHTWHGKNVVKPNLERCVQEVPEELVNQFEENAAIVEKLHSAFETESVPEVLQTWVYFILYVLRVPAHRNLRFDVLCGARIYLWKCWPKFVPQYKCDKRFTEMQKYHDAFKFYWECCYGDSAYINKKEPLPEILFSLYKDESDTHPTGIFLKDPTTSWDEVQKQVKGLAFETSSRIAERLMEIENFQDLFSIVVRVEKTKKGKIVKETPYILTGPIMFARVSCCSPFKPYIFTAREKLDGFKQAEFVSKIIPKITTNAMWYLTFKHPEEAAEAAAVQTGPEFLVGHADKKWPESECIRVGCICDSGMVSAGVVSQLEYQNQELILGEVDASEIVKTVVQSSEQVISTDISEAGAVLECY
jgi:hypothetical protein